MSKWELPKYGTRYLVFGNSVSRGNRGASDLISVTDDLEFILSKIILNEKGEWHLNNIKLIWWHVLDTKYLKIVAGCEDRINAIRYLDSMIEETEKRNT